MLLAVAVLAATAVALLLYSELRRPPTRGLIVVRDLVIAGLAVPPSLALIDVTTDEGLLGYARETGTTIFHPTSTCSLGAVVDEKLRVKGLRNLRVIDASVMPAVPSGNINAAVIAVAEKGADLLKEPQ